MRGVFGHGALDGPVVVAGTNENVGLPPFEQHDEEADVFEEDVLAFEGENLTGRRQFVLV